MSPTTPRRLFPLAAWLLALAALLAAPLRVAAAMTPPAKLASWGFDAPPPGRPGEQPPANQDGIRVGEPCAYESASGRLSFLSEDPIGFAGGSNFYAYANGDPIMWNDPLGLATDVTANRSRSQQPSLIRSDTFGKVFSTGQITDLNDRILRDSTVRKYIAVANTESWNSRGEVAFAITEKDGVLGVTNRIYGNRLGFESKAQQQAVKAMMRTPNVISYYHTPGLLPES